MKDKFQSLKKLNVGTVMSQPEQKNVLGGYAGTTFVYCYHDSQYLGWYYVYSSTFSGSYKQECQKYWPTTNRIEYYMNPWW